MDDLKAQNNISNIDPIDKVNSVLQILHSQTEFVGQAIAVNAREQFSRYHCVSSQELMSILFLLLYEQIINVPDKENPHSSLRITIKGYERLRALKLLRKDSRSCFVAMWLAKNMEDVYENAIRPAIEYIEDGENNPRFKALRIDNVDHTNDINDEIIASIRRSRFMVCDLTGYRGGVYFEAGFAYGLGLEVIYTCREDWIKQKKYFLRDKNDKPFEYNQEGIHFDLEHRNRIDWSLDDPNSFKEKLTKRIKAVIID